MKTAVVLLFTAFLFLGCTRDWSKYKRPDGGYAGDNAGGYAGGHAGYGASGYSGGYAGPNAGGMSGGHGGGYAGGHAGYGASGYSGGYAGPNAGGMSGGYGGGYAGHPGDGGLACGVPGVVSTCYCSSGQTGVQTCQPDGRYTACTCSASVAGSGGYAGPTGVCVHGASYVCTCADGRKGAQTCLEDGTYSACQCLVGNASYCGNGVIEGNERCDGTNLGGFYCAMLGYSYGTLRCASDCVFDLSGCSSYRPVDAGIYDGGYNRICGNGVIDRSNGEVCDGENLGGQSCVNLGYGGGTLKCDPVSCLSFLTDGCWSYL